MPHGLPSLEALRRQEVVAASPDLILIPETGSLELTHRILGCLL